MHRGRVRVKTQSSAAAHDRCIVFRSAIDIQHARWISSASLRLHVYTHCCVYLYLYTNFCPVSEQVEQVESVKGQVYSILGYRRLGIQSVSSLFPYQVESKWDVEDRVVDGLNTMSLILLVKSNYFDKFIIQRQEKRIRTRKVQRFNLPLWFHWFFPRFFFFFHMRVIIRTPRQDGQFESLLAAQKASRTAGDPYGAGWVYEIAFVCVYCKHRNTWSWCEFVIFHWWREICPTF